jgi:hypothetical protein
MVPEARRRRDAPVRHWYWMTTRPRDGFAATSAPGSKGWPCRLASAAPMHHERRPSLRDDRLRAVAHWHAPVEVTPARALTLALHPDPPRHARRQLRIGPRRHSVRLDATAARVGASSVPAQPPGRMDMVAKAYARRRCSETRRLRRSETKARRPSHPGHSRLLSSAFVSRPFVDRTAELQQPARQPAFARRHAHPWCRARRIHRRPAGAS